MNHYQYNLQITKNENAISYYILGAFMTDGCVYISKDRPNRKIVTLTSKDKDWLENINQYICPEKSLLTHGKNCFRIMYNCTELADWFISKGCIPKKSLILKFPNIPEQFLPDFIRGCWDGDGSISFTKIKGNNYRRQANFTSGSKIFCDAMSFILNKYHISNKIYCRIIPNRIIENRLISSNNNNYRIQLSNGESVYKLSKFIYYNSDKIYMKRKYIVAQKIITNWELPLTCTNCNILLTKTNKNHNKKYCHICYKQRDLERRKLRYHNLSIKSKTF